LQNSPNRATFDAIVVAMKMLRDQRATGPNADPSLESKIFILSNDKHNIGYSLNDIQKIMKIYGIRITTISYNSDTQELQDISNMTGTPYIKVDNDDIDSKLRDLFNATL
jgi:Ca-activated chloride channel homolog